MGKTYADFIVDLADDESLNKALFAAAPFESAEALRNWFEEKGYAISETDSLTIFQSQDMLLQEGENIAY